MLAKASDFKLILNNLLSIMQEPTEKLLMVHGDI